MPRWRQHSVRINASTREAAARLDASPAGADSPGACPRRQIRLVTFGQAFCYLQLSLILLSPNITPYITVRVRVQLACTSRTHPRLRLRGERGKWGAAASGGQQSESRPSSLPSSEYLHFTN